MPACKKHYESCLLDPLVRPIVDDICSASNFLFSGPPRSSGRTGVLIENNWIAPNTTLHMPVYSMHRDPTSFGLGDKFIPERWLDGADARKSADVKLLAFNRDAFVPFSAGYSSCVGKHLALQNIKYVTFRYF
jgi:Cytochrome P450